MDSQDKAKEFFMKKLKERPPLKALSTLNTLCLAGPSKSRRKSVGSKPRSPFPVDTKFVTVRRGSGESKASLPAYQDGEQLVIEISDDEDDDTKENKDCLANKKRISASTPPLNTLGLARVKYIKRSLKRPHSNERQGFTPVERGDDRVKRRLKFDDSDFERQPRARSESRLVKPSSEGGESNRRRCEEERLVSQGYVLESNAAIMAAIDRSDAADLIGDFSQPFTLPLTQGNHSDLKSISCDTLAGLIRGDFENVSDLQVIDCRYPYEFDGGHIAGAQNLYTRMQIQKLVEGPRPQGKMLVFHCEFSQERGPTLYRFLRSSDRKKNKENYPKLDYPEIYLLHDGYRAFYQRHPDLCSPAGYTAMLDPKHKDQLRQHRSVQKL